jgi:hypothetical protein
VVIEHHSDINPSNIEQLTVGRVADMHYNSDTDEWDVHFVVDNEDAVAKLQNGWGVSTAYRITGSGPGGTLNNVPYNREVTGAVYDHLAIVQDPRYEMARDPIFYNSKEGLITPTEVGNIDTKIAKQGGGMLGKLWRMVREEFKVNEGEELFVMVGDKEMKLNDLTAALHEMEMKKNMKKIIMNGSDMVEYKGDMMTVETIAKMFNEAKAEEDKKNSDDKDADDKKNAEDAEKKENEAKEKEEAEKKENEAKAEEDKKANEAKEKEEAEKKENEAKEKDEEEKRFNALKDVKNNSVAAPVEAYKTLQDRMDDARRIYGTTK